MNFCDYLQRRKATFAMLQVLQYSLDVNMFLKDICVKSRITQTPVQKAVVGTSSKRLFLLVLTIFSTLAITTLRGTTHKKNEFWAS